MSTRTYHLLPYPCLYRSSNSWKTSHGLVHWIFRPNMRKILRDHREFDRLITLKRSQPVIVGVKKPHRSPGTLVSTNCRISEDYAALTFLSIVLLVAKRLRASARSRGSRAPLGADRQVRGF